MAKEGNRRKRRRRRWRRQRRRRWCHPRRRMEKSNEVTSTRIRLLLQHQRRFWGKPRVTRALPRVQQRRSWWWQRRQPRSATGRSARCTAATRSVSAAWNRCATFSCALRRNHRPIGQSVRTLLQTTIPVPPLRRPTRKMVMKTKTRLTFPSQSDRKRLEATRHQKGTGVTVAAPPPPPPLVRQKPLGSSSR